MAPFAMFDRFLKMPRSRGSSFISLGTFLKDNFSIGRSAVVVQQIHAREGWISCRGQGVLQEEEC